MSGKVRIYSLLLIVLLLVGFFGLRVFSPKGPIARHPNPANFDTTLNVIPTYDPHSSDLWQVDLRSTDLTQLNLST